MKAIIPNSLADLLEGSGVERFGSLSFLVGFNVLGRRDLNYRREGGSAGLVLLVGLYDLGRRDSDNGRLL